MKDDESMDALVESIRMNGVLNPVIALKIDENHYQLISGHRRKHACVLLGIDRIPLIGREMTKEEAVIEMVDSNLQREHILPSEKARAYKMKMDAMKKQGERRDLTSNPVGGKLKGIETAEIIGDEAGESANQVRRYIRLNELTDAGYEIIKSFPVGNTEFVLGENIHDRARYVTWECTGGNNYFWGHYFTDKEAANKDLYDRVEAEVAFKRSIGEYPKENEPKKKTNRDREER